MPNTAESIHESLKIKQEHITYSPQVICNLFKSLTFILSSADAKSMLCCPF